MKKDIKRTNIEINTRKKRELGISDDEWNDRSVKSFCNELVIGR